MEDDLETNQPVAHRNVDDQWSNTECIKIAFKDHFPNAVTDKTVQKNIITRFLNFYLGGRIQKGIDVQDLVYSTVSIMPLHEVTEEFIFADFHYGKEGTLFFLSPEEKLKAEIEEVLAKAATEKEPDDEKLKEKDPEADVEKLEEEPEQEDEMVYKYNSLPEANDEKQNLVKDTEGAKDSSSDTHHDAVNMEPEDVSTKPKRQNEENFDLKFPENIRWFGDRRKLFKEETNRPQYGAVENAAFVASCNKLLEVWDTSQNARIILKYFFGVVALTLMRATTKTYKHLVNTFSSNKFLKNLPIKQYIRYSIPHKKCIKSSYRTFSRRDGNLGVMFAKIVINSFHIDARRREVAFGSFEDTQTNFATTNIFKVTILAHTANYGMGLLNMVQTIRDPSINLLNHLVEATFCEETAESWRRLQKFMEHYMATTSKETTHYWARVINGNYFRSLCCSPNYPLAVILAVFIEKITRSPGIWQSTWVGRGESLETYKELGIKMYEKYSEMQRKEFILDPVMQKKTPQLNEESEDLEADFDFSQEQYDNLKKINEKTRDVQVSNNAKTKFEAKAQANGQSSNLTSSEVQHVQTNDSNPGTSRQNFWELDNIQIEDAFNTFDFGETDYNDPDEWSPW